MIQKLKDLEQEAMDELDPETYDKIASSILDDYQRPIYQSGYIDGLQAAILAASENSGTHSYTIEMEDIFNNE